MRECTRPFDVSAVDEILNEHRVPINVEATTNAQGFKRIVDPSVPYATYAVFSSSFNRGYEFLVHFTGAITATLSQAAATPMWVPGPGDKKEQLWRTIRTS